MITTSLARLAAAGGMALALASGTGLANAEPAPPTQPAQPGLWSQNPAVNTTCSYSQVVAAINSQSPDAAAQFNASPVAQSFLQNFLAAPAPQREQMIEQAQGVPEAAQYVSLFGPLARICNNY